MDKPFYKRSEFWLTLVGSVPGISFGFAEVFLKAVGDGTLDPSNPLYGWFIGAATILTAVYTFSRQLNKAIDAFRRRDEVPVSLIG